MPERRFLPPVGFYDDLRSRSLSELVDRLGKDRVQRCFLCHERLDCYTEKGKAFHFTARHGWDEEDPVSA